MSFRERAKLYLEGAMEHSLHTKQAEALKAREAEIAELRQKQADAEAKHAQEMEELRSLIRQAAQQNQPRKRGRPKKLQPGTIPVPED